MNGGGSSTENLPLCSTSLAKGIYPSSPRESTVELKTANNFARTKTTKEMCAECFGRLGIICMLPGPQHPNQDIIPDVTPEIMEAFKANVPVEVLIWMDRILRGKNPFPPSSRTNVLHKEPAIIRRVMFEFGFPQLGDLATDSELNTILPSTPPEAPPVIQTPSRDQQRGVSPDVLLDLGFEPRA